MFDLEKDLEAIKPHHLVRSCVGRDHICTFPPYDVQEVFQVRLVTFLVLNFDGFITLRVLEVTRH